MSEIPSTFLMTGKLYLLTVSCTQSLQSKTEFKGTQMTHGNFICLRFSPEFTQSPMSCSECHRRGVHCVQNTVTEKKYFHICLCSVPFCTDRKITQLRAKKIQRNKLKMTVELFLTKKSTEI